MKFKIFIVLFLLTGICLSQEGQNKSMPTIQVKGNASIKVIPDIFHWQVNVQTESNDIKMVKKENDASSSAVLDLLRKLNIDSKDIKTSGINVLNNNLQYGNQKKFTAANNIWFNITDMNNYNELTTELTNIENVYISPVTADYSKAIEVRKQARTDALNAAKEKAVQMAGVYNLEIGRAINITEGQTGWYPNPFNMVTTSSNAPNTAGIYNSGMIDVTAEVTVIFELK